MGDRIQYSIAHQWITNDSVQVSIDVHNSKDTLFIFDVFEYYNSADSLIISTQRFYSEQSGLKFKFLYPRSEEEITLAGDLLSVSFSDQLQEEVIVNYKERLFYDIKRKK